ncbi:hypothetical protein K443DRAFT_293700 [Laccaria amethystina LaAM-08-1]|uniref:Uncharacterized protein n=1 Tax=Laccaria amethystina LaAM-08-1 TaxID=1095629 RepID=A0A0C9XEW2_9AGAR|nr:hypothetical protein K443DRAFT_293700 [Laccaria amethystina LaAM-08-1]
MSMTSPHTLTDMYFRSDPIVMHLNWLALSGQQISAKGSKIVRRMTAALNANGHNSRFMAPIGIYAAYSLNGGFLTRFFDMHSVKSVTLSSRLMIRPRKHIYPFITTPTSTRTRIPRLGPQSLEPKLHNR